MDMDTILNPKNMSMKDNFISIANMEKAFSTLLKVKFMKVIGERVKNKALVFSLIQWEIFTKDFLKEAKKMEKDNNN